MALYEDAAQVPLTRRAGVLVNYAGAAVSLGLMVGVGVWGYQLIMRDVTGIPVVRAMDGDMRAAPENPGGDVAVHTGLAVNAVAAVGEAAPPEDTLVLAPATPGLAAEDLEVQPMAEAQEVRPVDPVTAPEVETSAVLTDDDVADVPDAPLSTAEILALADQITAGATPMAALEGAVVPPTVALNGEDVAPARDIIPASVPGVSVSLRPTLRPARVPQVAAEPDAVAAALASATAATEAVEIALSTATPPPGTKLVQLGAFPSAEGAATAWVSLQGRFADYLAGKDRMIQEASSGGRTFYRLRAAGFDDLADARRFCAALSAGNADCIPVVVR